MIEIKFTAENVQALRQQMMQFLSAQTEQTATTQSDHNLSFVDRLFKLAIGQELRINKNVAASLSYARKKYQIGLKSKTIKSNDGKIMLTIVKRVA